MCCGDMCGGDIICGGDIMCGGDIRRQHALPSNIRWSKWGQAERNVGSWEFLS
jgi:hypothetical protein